ncbi:MAG: hypothetical protein A2804_03105 [Candidatus Pacebacteria bacterium RIFCSPHIGHO2_01_FULL_46_10]|nr:MAG: hypothetical protein A2804_03105 [Candidatus Pacebacteria bacterium RIFCSPHIGHO2_01_FULL_46_10]
MSKALVTAWKNIRRTPYQAIGVLLVLFNTFFLGYVYSIVFFGSAHLLQYVETRPQVIAFFKQTATDEQITQVQSEMTAKQYVQIAKITTKDQALAAYKENNKKDPLLSELVTADVFPASLEVSGKEASSLDQIQQDLSQHKDIIDDIVFQKDVVDTLVRWTATIRIVGAGMISVLLLTSLLVVATIISMKVTMKRQEVSILRLLGATSGYINLPFLLEGALYGIVSSVAAWMIVFVAMLYATPWLVGFLGDIPLLPTSPIFFVVQLASGTLLSVLLGMFASWLAVRRVIQ